jgi:hypothetical protein
MSTMNVNHLAAATMLCFDIFFEIRGYPHEFSNLIVTHVILYKSIDIIIPSTSPACFLEPQSGRIL